MFLKVAGGQGTKKKGLNSFECVDPTYSLPTEWCICQSVSLRLVARMLCGTMDNYNHFQCSVVSLAVSRKHMFHVNYAVYLPAPHGFQESDSP